MVEASIPTWESESNQNRGGTRAVRGDSAQSLCDPTASLDACPIPRLATSRHRIAFAVKTTSAPSGVLYALTRPKSCGEGHVSAESVGVARPGRNEFAALRWQGYQGYAARVG
jgi:hypothetical protein